MQEITLGPSADIHGRFEANTKADMAATVEADDNITFIGAISKICSSYAAYAQRLGTHGINLPEDLYSDWLKYGEYSRREVAYTVVLAIFFTLLRSTLSSVIFQPISRYFKLLPINQQKFPESAWKGLYCASIWGLQFYVLIYPGNYDYFWNSNGLWKEWAPRQPLPSDIYAIYMLQSGFYLHSIYAALYMDHWRRDGNVMVFHHVLTLSLLVSSYAARYHAIGVLLLFLHDFSDVCLEATKCNVYFKNRGGKYYKIHDTIATVGFLIFTLVWYVGRLYYCPIKVLYSAAYSVTLHAEEMGQFPFYLFFNTMLLSLQGLNIYWFMYILNLLYKVASGQLKEVDDVREEDVQDQLRQHSTVKLQQPQVNGNSHKKHHENGLKQRGHKMDTSAMQNNN